MTTLPLLGRSNLCCCRITPSCRGGGGAVVVRVDHSIRSPWSWSLCIRHLVSWYFDSPCPPTYPSSLYIFSFHPHPHITCSQLLTLTPHHTHFLLHSYMYVHLYISYSDGSVFLWDLTVDSEPAEMTQPTGVHAQSKPSCSVVRGSIAAVGTTGGEITLYVYAGL